MIKIVNLRAEIGYSQRDVFWLTAKKLGTESIKNVRVIRRAVDARRKNDVHYVLTLEAECDNESYILGQNIKGVEAYSPLKYTFPGEKIPKKRPVVVGTGPAGLFCALYLARMGAMPIVIERGADVDERTKAVETFWKGLELDINTNVQFGEGGAGTFSDGKLNTGTHDVRMRTVLEEFVRYGAPEDILVDSKPHIGTDILRDVVKNMRKEIIKHGAEVRFLTKLTDIMVDKGKVCAAVVEDKNGQEIIETDDIVLAIGHSARDTMEMLLKKGVMMEAKPFSVGVRIEHSQEFISRAMYGKYAQDLPPADYKMAVHLDGRRSVYTFCMCPGGQVVAAASEKESVVTNGMSYSKRDGKNANSALLVSVGPGDFGFEPLCGIEFQQSIERKAYEVAGNYFAPAQTVGSFMGKSSTNKPQSVIPTYMPGVYFTDLSKVLPEFVSDSLKAALVLMDRKIKGFADSDAILTAPETRSSSPVRFVRDSKMQLSIKGLYSAGEGGGHAGGITSSAVDGIRVAEAVMSV